ncbi:DJ-1 family glyoxalase III [Sulfuricurvum sp.]|uniref:DJ-1 family glyoxalase III n=1 Tax=Sulfuricurvum sp. TaxID=2025608 RepID=UPI00261DD3BD|nr:DJ-1 family glyoxalase III [Sulfuricurvum sp.]MDD4884199.1 DJ-1/PfpI family protein [Sulfuricurvum sp.]
MSTVLIPLATGFEEIEAVTIIDVLRRGQVEVIIGSLQGETSVRGAHAITIATDRDIADVQADELDMIVLPGGWGGTKALAANPTVQSLLKEMDAQNKPIGAICAAPFALDAAGVLKEGYTCYPGIEDELSTGGFSGDKHAVVKSGNILTSRGPATAMCFALEIVRGLAGLSMYEKLRADLLADDCAPL